MQTLKASIVDVLFLLKLDIENTVFLLLTTANARAEVLRCKKQWFSVMGYTVDVTNVFSELLKTIFSLNSFFSKIVDQKQTLAQY